ncbi:MAG: nitronate monooxygenase family protein [Eubacterium sp.]|nr:nitronate monooxygenase family protein [Eubacterium sp.]
MEFHELKIGKKTARIPIIQGGMGVGVSRSRLAGAVAKAGGVGMISSAQIGYDEPDFEQDVCGCNLRAIEKHVRLAKQQSDGGLVGVNVMVALKHYARHVRAAVQAGADLVVCGAGLPADLPELVGDADTAIAPIVSSSKAASVLLRMWDKKYHRTADLLVVEGPKAGGHLGFTPAQLKDIAVLDYDEEIRQIIKEKRIYESKYGVSIPVVAGGGIFDSADARHMIGLGADGVQVATRFVATEECDAADAYKQAYIQAKDEDVVIVQSPVGMPGRAIRNAFIQKAEQGKVPIKQCFQCIKKCMPKEVPYCITQALVNAVKGNLEQGLIFCGANVGRIREMTTVARLMQELAV